MRKIDRRLTESGETLAVSMPTGPDPGSPPFGACRPACPPTVGAPGRPALRQGAPPAREVAAGALDERTVVGSLVGGLVAHRGSHRRRDRARKRPEVVAAFEHYR